MAKANAKKRAEENKARIALLFRVLVSAVVTFAAVRLGLYRASSRWWHYPLFVTTSGAAWFCYTSLAFIAAPSYDANGALVDGGADLTIGGMSSYYHDIVYVAVFLLLSTALVSDWFWLIGLVVPGYALWMLWSKVVAPWIFNPTSDELEAGSGPFEAFEAANSRANETREEKRKRERAERKENAGGRSRRM